jgi:hypothetical protein
MDIQNIFADICEKTDIPEIAYNAIFVLCNARPSFLVQSIDYRETKNGPITLGPITLNILYTLEQYFKITKTYQGYIISNYNFNVPTELNDTIIGSLIGYPCAGDLHDEHKRNHLYKITVVCNKNNKKEEYDIMTVVCENENLHEFQEISSQMQSVLDIFSIDGSVEIKYKKLLHIEDIIYKLKNEEQITEEENNEVIRLLKNYGFGVLVKLNIDLYSKKNILMKIIEDCFYNLLNIDIIEHNIKILSSFDLSFTYETIKKMHFEIYGK